MGYMRMAVYSFECDAPGPHLLSGHVLCGEYESLPMHGTGLRGAIREIRHANWSVRDGKYFCPAHKEYGNVISAH